MSSSISSGSGEEKDQMNNNNNNNSGIAMMERMAGESAVVIFSWSRCCMCVAIKRLLSGMGVSPTVYELDLIPFGDVIFSSLPRGLSPPLVFVGGKLVGPTHQVISSHINGTLVPLLKDAGALWL